MPAMDEQVGPGGAAGHENQVSAPAPGALETVRSFLSVHDHDPSSMGSLPPSGPTLAAWFARSALADPSELLSGADLSWAVRVHAALRTKALQNDGRPSDPVAIQMLNDAAQRTGLRLCFGCEDGGKIHTDGAGVQRAIGTVLGIAFLAELDGTWARLHGCSAPDCASIFYDRTKNHSAKWCSMESCGNRNKVRRYRERQAAAGSPA